jgi:hypothetical protein
MLVFYAVSFTISLIDLYSVMVKARFMTSYVFCLITYAYFPFHQDVFYSRKNFERPDLQMSPHQAFEQEVALLDTFFKGICKPKSHVCFLCS